MNLLSYNSTTQIMSYNCGGFALRSFYWYCPDSYYKVRNELDMPAYEKIESFIQDILKDHPFLVKIDSYRNVPKRFDVVGFRLGFFEDDTVDDFHFILRHKGVWYHKPGSLEIEKFDSFALNNDSWFYDELEYNSETIWFLDTRKRENPNAFVF